MAFDPYRLVSAFGALLMLALAFALSRERKAISLRAVLWGVFLQWGLAVFLIRVPLGRAALAGAAEAVQTVLDQAYAGSAFVFGDLGAVAGGSSNLGVIFAFQVLPTIIFVASLFSVLYHVGLMQIIVRGLAWVMMRTMGTSGAESLSVAASVFMGQTEAPLTIKPFLDSLTESELFTVMVAGMASVSGAILGAYVSIGRVPIEHLLTSVAMTAPISLVIAKIMVPETDKPVSAGDVGVDIPKSDANLFDAAASGAGEGLKLAANVGAMLIAFIALVALCNVPLQHLWVAGEPVTLQRILGWLFAPIAMVMGVSWSEAADVGSILGTRTVVNELVAFEALRDASDHLSDRAKAISTVAVCGFANVSSIGILIGGLGGLVPGRRKDIARLGALALVAATLANFTSACVAGALL